jgi:hypothetical protein
VTIERSADADWRTWFATTPIATDRPDPGKVPMRRVGSHGIRAIGICAPEHTLESGAIRPGTMRIWRYGNGGTTRHRIIGARPVSEVIPGVAELYRPPAGATSWDPGYYLLEVRLRDLPLWFGVEIGSP